MQIIKIVILILILFASSYIGNLFSKKYVNRYKELKDMKCALNIFKTKIKLTYEPIPQIFEDISNSVNKNISTIFMKAKENMKTDTAGNAWKKSLDTSKTNLMSEDIEVLKGLSNLLGKVDVEGQVGEIELIDTFLDNQIQKADERKKKNEKMCKTLGVTVGLAIVIILI